MSKHPKGPRNNPQPKADQQHRNDAQRSITGDVRVHGQVIADFAPQLIQEYKTSNEKTEAREQRSEARENKRFIVEYITLFFVVLVAGIGVFQAYESKRATDATAIAAQAAKDSVEVTRSQFQLENRACLTVGEPQQIFGTPDFVKIPIINTGRVPTNGDHLKLWFLRLGQNFVVTQIRAYVYDTKARIPPGNDAFFYTILMPSPPHDGFQQFGPDKGYELRGTMYYDDGFGSRDTLFMCYDYRVEEAKWRNCSGQSMSIHLDDGEYIDPRNPNVPGRPY